VQAAIDGLAVCRIRGRAMANEGLINLLGWSRRERERLQMQREMLQSGKFKLLKDEGSGPIDVSSQNIAQITANIAELDLILAHYDVRSSTRDRSQSISSTLRTTIGCFLTRHDHSAPARGRPTNWLRVRFTPDKGSSLWQLPNVGYGLVPFWAISEGLAVPSARGPNVYRIPAKSWNADCDPINRLL
jgi:hypothetical protein